MAVVRGLPAVLADLGFFSPSRKSSDSPLPTHGSTHTHSSHTLALWGVPEVSTSAQDDCFEAGVIGAISFTDVRWSIDGRGCGPEQMLGCTRNEDPRRLPKVATRTTDWLVTVTLLIPGAF
ncbi:hypothetical protein GSI_12380 [Ganoderma sinense ZZ0214-1]|uniref:Uncharacterized protein n=1 Tax=Ganoderma sinense ZZ0214-1 TaxID=1077348 RepID=A0A2G8RVK3_9APHY|nr:hypothetical protein GSI_12380 [Ganoderma sinense ZZ0214-1]